MAALQRWIGGLAQAFGSLSAIGLLGLITVTMIEVVSRYALGAPRVWAYDVSYMLNGASVLLAGALTLKTRQHVVIDLISQFLPERGRNGLDLVFYALLLLPIFGLLLWTSWTEAWRAWQTSMLDHVSPWRPLLWPFRLALAVGLTALWLMMLSRLLEALAALFSPRHDTPADPDAALGPRQDH